VRSESVKKLAQWIKPKSNNYFKLLPESIMSYPVARILELLETFIDYSLEEKEKTIFSIGGRGHYENPISDVLAFYLDPNEEHGLGSLVLQALLDVSKVDVQPILIEPVYRELGTDLGNRLDLVLVGEDWIIAVENKVYHEAINPFDDYRAYLSKQYPEKEIVYVLLSPKDDVAEGWVSVSYVDLVEKIKSGLGSCLIDTPFSKWQVFLRDFLINLLSYTKGNSMDSEKFDFLSQKLPKIYELEKIRAEFLEEVRGRIQRAFIKERGEDVFRVNVSRWDTENGTPGFRVYSKDWKGESNVTIAAGFGEIESHSISAYVDGIDDAEHVRMTDLLQREWASIKCWREKPAWGAYKTTNSYDSLVSVIESAVNVGRLMPS